jgi:hypothetical protein
MHARGVVTKLLWVIRLQRVGLMSVRIIECSNFLTHDLGRPPAHRDLGHDQQRDSPGTVLWLKCTSDVVASSRLDGRCILLPSAFPEQSRSLHAKHQPTYS